MNRIITAAAVAATLLGTPALAQTAIRDALQNTSSTAMVDAIKAGARANQNGAASATVSAALGNSSGSAIQDALQGSASGTMVMVDAIKAGAPGNENRPPVACKAGSPGKQC